MVKRSAATLIAFLFFLFAWASAPANLFAQGTAEQEEMNRMQRELEMAIEGYSCAVSLGFGAITGGLGNATAGVKGKSGEQAVQKALSEYFNSPVPKNGRTYSGLGIKGGRIPDFVHKDWIFEVKNTRDLSYTRQIRDYRRIARDHKLKGIIVVIRKNTKISVRLLRAWAKGGMRISIIRALC